MPRLLALAAARFFLRHPWQLALAVAGICLGVAVYVGVELANDSARRAFDLSAAAVQGRTTHRLLPVGAAIADTVYADLVRGRRVEAAAPVVEALVAVGGAGGARRTLLGVDPVEELAFRDYSRFVPGRNADFETLIAEPGTVLLPEAIMSAIGARAGESLTLATPTGAHRVRIVGAAESSSGNVEAEPPILADVSTAQELLGRVGRLDRIDLVLTPEQAESLRAQPPRGTTLVPAGTQDSALAEMTRAFRTNLTALGLLALVVGMFLVYATISFAVVQRHSVIGLLRALGTPRRTLLASFVGEALGIGIVGTLLGLLLGHLLARGLVDLVLQTIGDLSFAATLDAARPSSWIYVRGALLGIGATALAAFVPALEAARSEPDAALSRARLERVMRARSRRALLVASPLLLSAAAVLLAVDDDGLVAAFAALFFVLCAGALAVPAATWGLTRALVPLVRRTRSLGGLMAVRGTYASLSRTGVAAAALAVAVATVIGISLMIASFRSSLVAWLDTTLAADVYLSADSGDTESPFTPQMLAAIAALPDVRALSASRSVRLPTPAGELPLRAAAPGPDGLGVDLVAGDAAGAARALAGSASVLVAEPTAFRLSVAVGDTLELPTPEGGKTFEVAGVYRDYSTAGSALLMNLEVYRRYWQDDTVTGVGVHLEPGVDTAAAASALRSALSGSGIRLRSTESIEEISLAVFDRTFEITEVLRLLAGLVAFLGVLSAALAVQLERTRELAVLRAIGMSRRQLGVLILTQTGLLGAAAAAAAVPIGAVLAALLVHVINRRSFGWSMQLQITAEPILLGVALAVGAALLAGVYPALRGSRTSIDAALRDE